MRTVHLAYQKDTGPHLHIQEAPWFWVTMELAGDDLFPEVTGHLFCCRIPEWAWELGWGTRDEWNFLPVSLGHYMSRFGQYLLSGFGAYRHFRTAGNVPLSVREVHDLFPDADPFFTGEGNDAMNSRPGDEGEALLCLT